jgi:hypothetical protein
MQKKKKYFCTFVAVGVAQVVARPTPIPPKKKKKIILYLLQNVE